MAFYGTKAEDDAVKTEACRWYVKGMGFQRKELEKASSPSHEHQLDITSVLAPLMFSIFESIMMTAKTGWVQHMHAACKFLEILGPEACQDGLAYNVLRSVRLGVVSLISQALQSCEIVCPPLHWSVNDCPTVLCSEQDIPRHYGGYRRV